jgi:hypothetical protein
VNIDTVTYLFAYDEERGLLALLASTLVEILGA